MRFLHAYGWVKKWFRNFKPCKGVIKVMSKEKTIDLIAENRKARHEYLLEQFFEAGIMLQGWEVKSLRAGRAQIADGYVIIKNGEAWLINANITPLITASTHVKAIPDRTRKLLLHEDELKKLIGLVERKGYTIVPVNLHWRNNVAKLDIALAKGKKQYDKREAEKKRDWDRQKQQLQKLSKR